MCNIKVLRTLAVVFNCIFLVLGLGMAGVGFWIRFKHTDYDELLGELMPLTTVLLMAAGGLVSFVALLGCCGALTNNTKVLTAFFVLLLLMFLLQAAVSVLGFTMFDQLKPTVGKVVVDAVTTTYGYEKYDLLTDAIDFMQHELRCCGYNHSSDWTGSKFFTSPETAELRGALVLPRSCCLIRNKDNCGTSSEDSNIFTKGCVDVLVDLFHTNLKIIGGIGMGVALLELFGMVVAACLCCSDVEGDRKLKR